MIRIHEVHNWRIAYASMGKFLLDSHYAEVGNPVYERVNPDFGKYEAIADQGNLLMLLAQLRCESADGGFWGTIGYSVNIITEHIHYEHAKVCCNDVLYIAPAWRNTSAGGRLMAATRKAGRERGASIMQWHAKPGTSLDATLSKRHPVFEHVYQETL